MATLAKDFTKGNVLGQMFWFALPLFISNLLQILYNIADMIIVGHVIGKIGISAVAVGGDITNFLTFWAMGFSNAGQIIIAQYLGARQLNNMSRFVCSMIVFLILSSLVISVTCLFYKDALLRLMNTPVESYEEARDYITITMAGLLFVYGYNVSSAIMRGMGDSKHPFIFISIAAVLNILLDIWFIIYLDMSSKGAALATVVSQAVSFILCSIFVWKNQKLFYLKLKWKYFWHPSMVMVLNLIKLGIPMALKTASVQFSKVFLNSWINSYGVTISAMSGIANKMNSISNLFANAVSASGSAMVGQNIGAEKYNRVPKIMAIALGIAMSISLLMCFTIYVWPQQVFGLFTRDGDVMRAAMEFLPIAIIMFIGSASRAPMNSLINGSGNYKLNFLLAVLDGIVMRIGMALFLGVIFEMAYVGLWLGDALAGYTPFVIGLIYYLSGKWRRKSYLFNK